MKLPKRRLAILLLCAFLPAVGTSCITVNKGDDDGGDDPPAADVSGSWAGGGQYYRSSAGKNLSMTFTLDLALQQQGTAVTGTNHFVRPGLNRTNPVFGTLVDGRLRLHCEPDYDLDGTVSGDTVTFAWTETASNGVQLFANGTLTRN